MASELKRMQTFYEEVIGGDWEDVDVEGGSFPDAEVQERFVDWWEEYEEITRSKTFYKDSEIESVLGLSAHGLFDIETAERLQLPLLASIDLPGQSCFLDPEDEYEFLGTRDSGSPLGDFTPKELKEIANAALVSATAESDADSVLAVALEDLLHGDDEFAGKFQRLTQDQQESVEDKLLRVIETLLD